MKFLHLVIVGLAGAALVSLSAVANELTLRSALEKAVQGNSELQKYPYQQRMAEAEKIQAGLKPNPSVGLELENIAGSGRNQGVDNLQATLSFSQVIELGGKREQRIEFASVKQKQLNAEFNYAKIDVLAETTSRFYKLVQLQQLANWNQQQQQRLQEALSVARDRVKSGAVPPSEETRIELQQRQILAEHEEIKGKIAAAKFRLSAMWAGSLEFSEVIGTFAGAPQIPSQADVDDAVNQAPELLRLLDSERLLEARARAFEAGSSADLTLDLGVRYNNEFDDTGLVIQASMPLQLENPNAGNIQSNQAERDMVLEQQRILRDKLRAHTRMVLARLHTNHQYLRTIESDLLPLARQLEHETEDGYSRGIQSLLQLLDSQEELALLEYQQINRRYAIYQDILELERMTGQSFLGSAL